MNKSDIRKLAKILSLEDVAAVCKMPITEIEMIIRSPAVIRKLRETRSVADIAAYYGVAKITIYKILAGKSVVGVAAVAPDIPVKPSILSDMDVLVIRNLRDAGQGTCASLAKVFNVSTALISQVARRVAYKEVVGDLTAEQVNAHIRSKND